MNGKQKEIEMKPTALTYARTPPGFNQTCAWRRCTGRELADAGSPSSTHQTLGRYLIMKRFITSFQQVEAALQCPHAPFGRSGGRWACQGRGSVEAWKA